MSIVKGFIDHIIYRNENNGYTVLSLSCEKEDITAVGFFRTFDEGECIEAEGEFIAHQVYGEQFKINSYSIVVPSDAVAMERYLGSGAIKGLGPALAKRVVKKFGDDTFRIMEEEPERLIEIKGISQRKAQEIVAQLIEKKDMREVMIFLQQYGISNSLSIKIYKEYGISIYGIMKENPYRLAEEVDGIGFKIADEIASKIGMLADSDYRIQSGILYVLMQGMLDGNTFLPQQILLNKTSDLLGLDQVSLEPILSNMMMDKKIIIKQNQDTYHIYAMNSYYAELNSAKMLHDLNVSIDFDKEYGPEEKKKMSQKIMALEKKLDIELDHLQRRAVFESIEHGLFVLSGGPGTGKTTTINAMIQYFQQEGMDILLAAPTGRAAKRMTETTGFEARTIHRLLEINGMLSEDRRGMTFERNEENPLEADVIIIDEMSMVDIFLFQSLLKAITVGTRLIMVGDMNQLPSVGPGQVLEDIIKSQQISVVKLEKIFRQAGESDIVVNAHLINQGKNIKLDNKSKDFFFLERNDINVIYKHMVQLITEKMPKYVDATTYDIQVLTPMRKGPLGVETLNNILQEHLNPPNVKKNEHIYGDKIFRVGDKVMQIKNNYELEWEIVSKYGIPIDNGIGIFNGDIGIILDIQEYAQTLTVEFDEHRRVTYSFAGLEELELSYAITIHKSQGSEYPAIIMPLYQGPKMLFNRNLLYTGVTRAKKCVTILGSSQCIYDMIQNENQQKRYTGLSMRLKELTQIGV